MNDQTWRCGHPRIRENTHGGTERTHAQCWTCRARSQARANAQYRSTMKGYRADVRAQTNRKEKCLLGRCSVAAETYHGKPCQWCGNTARLRSDRTLTCADRCNPTRRASRAKDAARWHTDPRYRERNRRAAREYQRRQADQRDSQRLEEIYNGVVA